MSTASAPDHRLPLNPAGPDPATEIAQRIGRFIEAWREQNGIPPIWRNPLVAIATASDPLFTELRRAVAADHLMPEDLLPGARSVITFFLPFVHELGKANQAAGSFAARSWAEAYLATNQLIAAINAMLAEKLDEINHRTAVTPATHNFDEKRLLSRWSHKHIAYIAGLGTFGRHHLLITAAGCCGRLGSLVTTAAFAAGPRPNREYCLARAGHRCSACVQRCVYGALGDGPFDRHKCYQQLLSNDRHFSELPLVDVCGKCGSEVPCSYGIPASSEKTGRPGATV